MNANLSMDTILSLFVIEPKPKLSLNTSLSLDLLLGILKFRCRYDLRFTYEQM